MSPESAKHSIYTLQDGVIPLKSKAHSLKKNMTHSLN